MFKLLPASILPALLCLACAGGEGPAPGAAVQASHASQAQSLCVATFQRQRECTASFLPGLVDLRVRLDKPAGIAAKAQSEGREALLAAAHQEWAHDSTDPAIGETCTGMVEGGMGGADAVQAMRSCLDAAACGEFVPCTLGMIEAKLAQ